MKAHSSVTKKPTNTAPSAGNWGQKRKSEVQDDAASVGHNEHPLAKKGKAAAQQTRPVPCPLQKKTQHSEVQEDEGMDPIDRRNTNKRLNEDVNLDNDPKTPVPLKKVKTGLNEKSRVAPIHRTGKPIFFSTWLDG